jgi:hypothetical protein
MRWPMTPNPITPTFNRSDMVPPVYGKPQGYRCHAMRVHDQTHRVTDLAGTRRADAIPADEASQCAGYFRSATRDARVSGDIVMCAG